MSVVECEVNVVRRPRRYCARAPRALTFLRRTEWQEEIPAECSRSPTRFQVKVPRGTAARICCRGVSRRRPSPRAPGAEARLARAYRRGGTPTRSPAGEARLSRGLIPEASLARIRTPYTSDSRETTQ